MSSYTAVCSRCGAKMNNIDFNNHVCKGMRKLSELSGDLLMRKIKKEITEDEMWAIHDAK